MRASTLDIDLGALAGMAGGSLMTASLGATVVLILALPVAVLGARFPGRLTTATERLAFSGYALPGIVVALAFVFAGAGLPLVYQTLPLLLLAYAVLFLPQASEPIRSALLQVPPRLEEAGRILGRTRTAVFRRVVLPQAARGLAAGFALVFLTVMKELPATLLLRPTGFETLATGVWTESSVGRFGDASIPALLLVTLSALPLYLVARRFETQEVRAE
jgi:iron(III) transport system permease protein